MWRRKRTENPPARSILDSGKLNTTTILIGVAGHPKSREVVMEHDQKRRSLEGNTDDESPLEATRAGGSRHLTVINSGMHYRPKERTGPSRNQIHPRHRHQNSRPEKVTGTEMGVVIPWRLLDPDSVKGGLWGSLFSQKGDKETRMPNKTFSQSPFLVSSPRITERVKTGVGRSPPTTEVRE